MSDEWAPRDFSRRSYSVEQLGNVEPLSVEVRAGGRLLMRLLLHEPGLVAVVSRPDRDGVDVELVQPGPAPVTDHGPTVKLEDWQLVALGLYSIHKG